MNKALVRTGNKAVVQKNKKFKALVITISQILANILLILVFIKGQRINPKQALHMVQYLQYALNTIVQAVSSYNKSLGTFVAKHSVIGTITGFNILQTYTRTGKIELLDFFPVGLILSKNNSTFQKLLSENFTKSKYTLFSLFTTGKTQNVVAQQMLTEIFAKIVLVLSYGAIKGMMTLPKQSINLIKSIPSSDSRRLCT